jgi:hypothetical protein
MVCGSIWLNPFSITRGKTGAVNALVAWSILNFPTRLIYIYMVLPVPAVRFNLCFVSLDAVGGGAWD